MTAVPSAGVPVEWHGPFRWLADDDNSVFSVDVGTSQGAYLQTVETPAGYLVYAAGVTTRSFRTRLWEHTKEYLAGVYNVLDPVALAAGSRRVLWEGLWYTQGAPARLQELLSRGDMHFRQVEALLRSWRVFLAPLPKDRRLLERIEAGLMSALYAGPPEIAGIPDRGMHLCPRSPSEIPLTVHNVCSVVLRGVPEFLEV